jgi:hypothetical protein
MPVIVDGHVHLDNRATMLAVLDELVGEDAARFRGTVSSWPEGNPPGPARWRIEINDHRGNQTVASLGDHLVLTYGRLLRLSDDEFQDLNAEGS